MSEKVEGKTDGTAQEATAERDQLSNALRFEQAKNKVLLDEVVTLEDELVNRFMGDFDAIVTDETRDFWREQLLTNREPAMAALKEMQRCRVAGAEGTRRPLHNRAVARPVIPGAAAGGTGGGGDSDDRAAKIRNRAQEISKSEKIPFSAAFRRAERELGGR